MSTSSYSAIGLLVAIGADRQPHLHGSLLAHLIGTAKILEDVGCDSDTCRAGLFHSVYGTQQFKGMLLSLDDRARVRAQIGEAAERLAWLFASIERREFAAACVRGAPYAITLLRDQGAVTLSQRDVEQLAALLWANQLEQSYPGEPMPAEIAKLKALVNPALQDHPPAQQRPVSQSPLTVDMLLQTSTAEFLRDYWPSRLLVSHGSPARFGPVFPAFFEHVAGIPCSFITAFYRADGRQRSLSVNAAHARALYAAGMTIYFHSLSAPGFNNALDGISAQLGLVRAMTRLSCFASRRGLGVPMHYDLNDNIVIQMRGCKKWRLAPNEHVQFPTEGYTAGNPLKKVHHAEAPNGFPDAFPEPHQTVELRAGSTMFVPRGWWHDCETTDSESLHFNIQLGVPSWKDLLSFFATDALTMSPPAVREGVLDAFRDGTLRADYREVLVEHIQKWAAALSAADVRLSQSEFEAFGAKLRNTTL